MTMLKTLVLTAATALAPTAGPVFAQSNETGGAGTETPADGPRTIVVYFTTKPGMEQTARDVVDGLVHDVTAEDRNIQVAMFQDPEEPRSLLFVESFTSRAAEKAHTQTPHMAAFCAATQDFVAGPAEVKYWARFGMVDGPGRTSVTFAN